MSAVVVPLRPAEAALLPRPAAVQVFLVFAFTYFFSALLRAVTATLAPAFSAELGLRSADLGLLAGAYFLGFAAMQLPLGGALDRFGPRRVLVALLALAVAGCAAFALARGLAALIAARMLIGVGVGACLMAPLTCFRRHYAPAAQLRANSWMLMTGSLGMLASTLPVQLLLPVLGWRGLFWWVAAMLALAMLLIAARVPRDGAVAQPASAPATGGYGEVLRHPLFRRMALPGFFIYGGLIAVQALWVTFMGWGVAMPHLMKRGFDAVRLMTWGLPVTLALLALNIALGADAGPWHWAAWCVSCSVVSLSQPAVGMAFPTAQAGRALSAFNLVIFAGVFALQWGIGLAADALAAAGRNEAQALRIAFGFFWCGCVLAWWVFWRAGRPSRR